MPTYEYLCKNCGHRQNAFQKITDPPLKKCEECSKESLQRGFGGGVGLSFQGDGFYITDYGPKNSETKKNEGCQKSSCNCQ